MIGTDLSMIQPTSLVPNCSFVREDAEDDWVHPHKFDYIHLRTVFSCFDSPKEVMRRAFDNMNPGGWIEFQDAEAGLSCPDDTIEGTALQRWSQLLIHGGLALGRDTDRVRHYADWLADVGFVDIVQVPVPIPGTRVQIDL